MKGVEPPVGLLVLSGLYTALAITVKFLTIGTKAVLAECLADLSHKLQVVGQVVDGIELGPQDLIRLLEVI